MNESTPNMHEFYSSQGPISNPDQFASVFDTLPVALADLVQSIQGVMLHLHWVEKYGIKLDEVRQAESNLRSVKDRLAKIIELEDAPLTDERPLSRKTVGTCRDFALFLTAVLRHRNIPSRARAGFGTYFSENGYEDHWVCEFWEPDQNRWVMVDPQLDTHQKDTLSIDFDPLDMPHSKFITGAQAWLRCQAKLADPNQFGIFNMHGIDFIKGNLIRDFLALNKIEILPWDNFKLINKPLQKMNPDENKLINRLAQVSTGDVRDFVLLRSVFKANHQHLLPDHCTQLRN